MYYLLYTRKSNKRYSNKQKKNGVVSHEEDTTLKQVYKEITLPSLPAPEGLPYHVAPAGAQPALID